MKPIEKDGKSHNFPYFLILESIRNALWHRIKRNANERVRKENVE